jgi:hypothetical protein
MAHLLPDCNGRPKESPKLRKSSLVPDDVMARRWAFAHLQFPGLF